MNIITLGRYSLTWLLIVACCGLLEVYPQQAMQCGVKAPLTPPKRRKRVIGGNIAQTNSWPWLVNLIDKSDSRQYCSGAIIDRFWILTVAHCFIFYEFDETVTLPLTNYKYVVADHRYNVTDPHQYTVEPLQLFIHPKYKLADTIQPGDYDIALIKLKNPLKLTKHVNRVCVPTTSARFDINASCYLAGWGNTINTSQYHRSPVLRQVKLKLVSYKECNSKTAYNGTIPKRFQCAGYVQGGKDGCYGDSGAPLQCYHQADKRWVVAGIMSWGSGCGKPNSYGVYTDVQYLYASFINPVLQGPVNSLITYHKRPLNRFRKISKVTRKSFYLLFTKSGVFTDVDLLRNLQLNSLQITLLKRITLVDYAFVMDTTVQSLVSKSTPVYKIVAGFLQNSKKFENYDQVRKYAKRLNHSVAKAIKISGLSKAKLLNATNILKIFKNVSQPTKVLVRKQSG